VGFQQDAKLVFAVLRLLNEKSLTGLFYNVGSFEPRSTDVLPTIAPKGSVPWQEDLQSPREHMKEKLQGAKKIPLQ
jgi:hypothetical protein